MVSLLGNGKPVALSQGRALAAAWVAAGCAAWLGSALPAGHLLSGGALLRASVQRTLVTFLAAAFAARLSQTPRESLWRLAAAGAWFAPLAVSLSTRSLWSAAAAAVLAASAVTLLRPFPAGNSEALSRRAFAALCASMTIQTGALALFLNLQWAAVPLAACSAALLAWLVDEHRPSGPASSWRRVVLLTGSATLFTAAGLVRYLPAGSGFGGWGSRSAGDIAAKPFGGQGTANVAVGDVYRGVILWPEIQQYASLVPPLPALGHGFNLSKTRPLSIPFFGAYWFYKAPDRHLPDNSFRTRGDPAAVTFRSTDHRPMRMEAHQNLGTLIDLSCCSRMEVVVRNGDHYPGSVSLEVILADTTVAGRPSESLGIAPVLSIPRWRASGGDRGVPETLNFPIRVTSNLQRFDDITVIFKVTAMRGDRSARIAIDRFLLLPRRR